MGYCPQFDTLFESLTVEQHLNYYSKLKRIPKNMAKEIISKTIVQMNLEQYRHKIAMTLSGGNKRKLSVAMAILGNPPLVLLDEPSAGMDPEARRFMWSVVAKVSQEKKRSGVIISTHSMEEAEALSTKMGILVKGGIFRCFGSAQHIKNKFGVGYEVEVKFVTLSDFELNATRKLLSLPPDLERMHLQDVIEKLKIAGVDQMIIDELVLSGTGKEFVEEQEDSGNVSLT